MDDSDKQSLVHQACSAAKHAYAPYSKYIVGAAILTKNDNTYTGVNVENAAYGSACCAERVAVFKAVSEGQRNLKAIAVVTENGGTPCGPCRQVLHEFNPNIIVIIGNLQGEILKEYSLKDLLPNGFGPHDLVETTHIPPQDHKTIRP